MTRRRGYLLGSTHETENQHRTPDTFQPSRSERFSPTEPAGSAVAARSHCHGERPWILGSGPGAAGLEREKKMPGRQDVYVGADESFTESGASECLQGFNYR